MYFTYHDYDAHRTVLKISEERTRMTVLVINRHGLLAVKKLNIALDGEHLVPVDYGKGQLRKMNASMRKLAKKAGTSRKIREMVQSTLKSMEAQS